MFSLSGKTEAGAWVAFQAALIMARQSGKGLILEALERDAMKELPGKISDRIRGGKLPKDVVVTKTERHEPPPSDEAVRAAKGRSLGTGAERRRNGGAS